MRSTGASVQGDLLSGAAGLWMATVLHKAAVLGFSFCVGHGLGAEGVGVMASVLAISWMVSTLAGWGLPDRATFLGAAGDQGDASRRSHGTFILMVMIAHGSLLLGVEHLAGVEKSEFVSFSIGLIVGAAGHSISAVGFSWLRGAGHPRMEIVSTTVAAVSLLGGALVSVPLGMAWAISGLIMTGGAVLAGGLKPALPAFSDVGHYFRSGSRFLVFGLGAWVLGNIDILMARILYAAEFVGDLQVGTMAVRGLALAPWLAATFMLRPSREAWMKGVRPHPWRWSGGGVFVGVLVAGIAWIATPFLARGHAMPVASIEDVAWMSMVMAPAFYAMVILLPLAAQWHMNRTLRAIGMGLIVQVGVGWAAADSIAVSSLVVVAGLGQLVTLMWLIQTLGSTSQQCFEMDRSTFIPGED